MKFPKFSSFFKRSQSDSALATRFQPQTPRPASLPHDLSRILVLPFGLSSNSNSGNLNTSHGLQMPGGLDLHPDLEVDVGICDGVDMRGAGKRASVVSGSESACTCACTCNGSGSNSGSGFNSNSRFSSGNVSAEGTSTASTAGAISDVSLGSGSSNGTMSAASHAVVVQVLTRRIQELEEQLASSLSLSGHDPRAQGLQSSQARNQTSILQGTDVNSLGSIDCPSLVNSWVSSTSVDIQRHPPTTALSTSLAELSALRVEHEHRRECVPQAGENVDAVPQTLLALPILVDAAHRVRTGQDALDALIDAVKTQLELERERTIVAAPDERRESAVVAVTSRAVDVDSTRSAGPTGVVTLSGPCPTPTSPWRTLLEPVTGPRSPEEYVAQVRCTLRARREGREWRRKARFWKGRAREGGRCVGVVTPSGSGLSEIVAEEEGKLVVGGLDSSLPVSASMSSTSEPISAQIHQPTSILCGSSSTTSNVHNTKTCADSTDDANVNAYTSLPPLASVVFRASHSIQSVSSSKSAKSAARGKGLRGSDTLPSSASLCLTRRRSESITLREAGYQAAAGQRHLNVEQERDVSLHAPLDSVTRSISESGRVSSGSSSVSESSSGNAVSSVCGGVSSTSVATSASASTPPLAPAPSMTTMLGHSEALAPSLPPPTETEPDTFVAPAPNGEAKSTPSVGPGNSNESSTGSWDDLSSFLAKSFSLFAADADGSLGKRCSKDVGAGIKDDEGKSASMCKVEGESTAIPTGLMPAESETDRSPPSSDFNPDPNAKSIQPTIDVEAQTAPALVPSTPLSSPSKKSRLPVMRKAAYPTYSPTKSFSGPAKPSTSGLGSKTQTRTARFMKRLSKTMHISRPVLVESTNLAVVGCESVSHTGGGKVPVRNSAQSGSVARGVGKGGVGRGDGGTSKANQRCVVTGAGESPPRGAVQG